MNRHLGLKPQAESCSPYGTKSGSALRTLGSAGVALFADSVCRSHC